MSRPSSQSNLPRYHNAFYLRSLHLPAILIAYVELDLDVRAAANAETQFEDGFRTDSGMSKDKIMSVIEIESNYELVNGTEGEGEVADVSKHD